MIQHTPRALLGFLFLVGCDSVTGGMSMDPLVATGSRIPDHSAPIVSRVWVNGSHNLLDGRVAVDSRDITVFARVLDRSGVRAACIGTDPTTCTDWQPWQGGQDVELAAGDGQKDLYLFFEDGAGNRTTRPMAYSVTLDRYAPLDGTVSVELAAGSVGLDWGRFIDAGVGIERYLVVAAPGAAPASCDEGDLLYTGGASSFSTSDLQIGERAGIRVCAEDHLGRRSPGASVQVVPVSEIDAPKVIGFGPVDGEHLRTSRQVDMRLDAEDESGISAMCVALEPNCDDWQAYSETFSVVLADADGGQTVWVWLEDAQGNRSAAPHSVNLWLNRPLDADGDGFATDVDCDDEDPAVNPSSPEVCNGVDDDCNGASDERDPGLRAETGIRAFVDADLDGVGDAGAEVVVCEVGVGYSLTLGDCDDSDSSVRPGAVEHCDGVDQDCDGAVDNEQGLFSGWEYSLLGDATVAGSLLTMGEIGDGGGIVFAGGDVEERMEVAFQVLHSEGTLTFGWTNASAKTAAEAALAGAWLPGMIRLDGTGVSLVKEGGDVVTWEPIGGLSPAGHDVVLTRDGDALYISVDGEVVLTQESAEGMDRLFFVGHPGAAGVRISDAAWTCPS